MNEGDLVICPKAPDKEHFTIVRVCGDYYFDIAQGQKDSGHIIPVKDQHVVANWLSDDSQTIHALFRSANFWSAINQVPEYRREDIVSGATRLLQQENTLTPQSPENLLKGLIEKSREDAARRFIKYIHEKWLPHQFEAAVGKAFERKGYERLHLKRSRNGGDADHVFCLPISGIGELAQVYHPF